MTPKEAAKLLASPRLLPEFILWETFEMRQAKEAEFRRDRNKRKAARKVIRAAGGVVGPS